MKSKDWNMNRIAEIKYKTSLKKLLKIMNAVVKDSGYSTQMIEALSKLSKDQNFIDLSINVATRFTTHLNSEEEKTWKEVAKELKGGKILAEMFEKSLDVNVRRTMEQTIASNAKLISEIPLGVSEKITDYVASETRKGYRADQISKNLKKKYSQYSESKINLIARTEASKGSTALTESRSKDVGSMWYVWRTANDGNRVRDSHQIMQGVVCNWNDPPSPELLDKEKFVGNYHPGGIWNCRCWPQPVILLSQLRFPIKIHINGSIVRMNKEDFIRLGGM